MGAGRRFCGRREGAGGTQMRARPGACQAPSAARPSAPLGDLPPLLRAVWQVHDDAHPGEEGARGAARGAHGRRGGGGPALLDGRGGGHAALAHQAQQVVHVGQIAARRASKGKNSRKVVVGIRGGARRARRGSRSPMEARSLQVGCLSSASVVDRTAQGSWRVELAPARCSHTRPAGASPPTPLPTAAPAVGLLLGAGREGGLQHPLLPAAVEPQDLVAPPHARALAAQQASGWQAGGTRMKQVECCCSDPRARTRCAAGWKDVRLGEQRSGWGWQCRRERWSHSACSPAEPAQRHAEPRPGPAHQRRQYSASAALTCLTQAASSGARASSASRSCVADSAASSSGGVAGAADASRLRSGASRCSSLNLGGEMDGSWPCLRATATTSRSGWLAGLLSGAGCCQGLLVTDRQRRPPPRTHPTPRSARHTHQSRTCGTSLQVTTTTCSVCGTHM